MKNKYIYLLLIAICCATSTNAQSLKDLILKMPQSVCPLLSEYNKLEIVDNQKNNKALQTRNSFQTVSEMKVLTDDFAFLKTTKNTEKTFKLLTSADGEKLIIVVSTVYIDDKPDSSVELYDTNWTPLDASTIIDEPKSSTFRYIELHQNDMQMNIITGNPLAIKTDGTLDIPKVETTKETKEWKGRKFE